MDLPVDFLRTFVAVADLASFTRAAGVVGRTQSAVSQQIRRLEEQVGRALFTRGAGAVSLTRAGESLMPYARRMVKIHREAVSALMEPEMAGLVRLGMLDDYAAFYLPPVLEAFAADHPRVLVEVRCDCSRELLRLLEARELDLALHSGDVVPPGSRLIDREPLVWVASRNHHVHEQDPVPLAVFDKTCRFRHWALDALDKAGKAYRVAYTSPSVTGVLAAVGAGLAVAPLGRSSVPADVLVLGEIHGFPALPVTSIILSLADGEPPDPVRRLADAVAEGMAEGTTRRRSRWVGFEP